MRDLAVLVSDHKFARIFRALFLFLQSRTPRGEALCRGTVRTIVEPQSGEHDDGHDTKYADTFQEVAPRHIADEEDGENRDHKQQCRREILRRDHGKRDKSGEKNRKSDFSGASIGLLGVGHEGRGIKNDAEFVEFGGLNAQTENRNPARTVVDVLSDEVGGKKQNKRSESTEQSQMIDVAKMNELHHKSSECSQR